MMEESGAKSIKKNYIYSVCYQLLLVVAPLITTPYVSRVLEADGVGIVSYTDSIVSYFVLLASMGISTYGQRAVSYVQDSREDRSIVFWNTKILSLFTSSIAIAVYVVFAHFQANKAIYYIYSLNIISVALDVTWFFQGLEEFGRIVCRNVIIRILNIIYIFTVVRTRGDILLYVFGLVFFGVVSNISLWLYLPRYISCVSKDKIHPFGGLKTVILLFVPTVAIQVYTVLDRTMIGVITRDSFENGYYAQAVKISKLVLSFVSSLCTVMIPRIGFYYMKGNEAEVKRLMYKGYRFVWFMGVPLSIGLALSAGSFVPWFFGERYEKVIPLIEVLSLLILAIGINGITGAQYLIPTQRENIYTITVVIGACTNFALNCVLINRYQSMGAAVASVLAETVIAVVQLVMVRSELSIVRIIKEGVNYYVAGGVMAAVLMVVRKMVMPTVAGTLTMVSVGAAIYFGMLLIMRDGFLLSNIKMIFRKFKRG